MGFWDKTILKRGESLRYAILLTTLKFLNGRKPGDKNDNK